MSVSTYALVTLAEAKVFPGLSGLAATEDAILEALIDAATFDFEAYWDNAGVQRAFTERYSYADIKAKSPAADVIWLNKYPVVSVTSITDPANSTVAATDYWIDYDHGALRTTGGWTIPQDSNAFTTYWTIVYTAGRVANTAAVPANIKLGCKMWVASLYKRSDRDVVAKSIGDFSVRYKELESDEGGLPVSIRHLISAWKKRQV